MTTDFTASILILVTTIPFTFLTATPVPTQSTDENLALKAYAFGACAECDYFLNGCPPPDGIFGVDCPPNGKLTCDECLALEKLEASNSKHSVQKRSSACLHYGNLCGSNGYCCHDEGLSCQTNAEGRGRNHLVCAYS